MTPWDLFVSYAHRDERDDRLRDFVALAQEVQRGLDPAQPWHVFFDTHAIRVLDDWEKRIGSGLRSAGVMLALVSPAYFQSEWCRREWAAFREQERRRGEPRDRLAILYLETDPSFDQPDLNCEWRRDLKRRQYLDLRGWASLDEAARRNLLSQLVHAIHGRLSEFHSNQARQFGAPYQFPNVPDQYVTRQTEEAALQSRLLGDSPHGSVVFGQGGIGKSTLVSGVVRKPAILDCFPDGVLWATLGQEPETGPLLNAWIQALEPADLQARTTAQATATLKTLLQHRAVLLVIDDAWRLEDLEAFNVAGPRCRTVITTRDNTLAKAIGATVFELSALTPDQAVALLEGCLGRALGEPERVDAEALAREVGHLPLALELAAVQVKDGETWAGLVEALRTEFARLEAFDHLGAEGLGEAYSKRLSLTASLNLSLRRLPTDRREQFAWLGIAAEDSPLTVGLAATLWQVDEPTARKSLVYLRDKALLLPGLPRPDGTPTYRLHDLLGDCARRLLQAPPRPHRPGDLPGLELDLASAHAWLLECYRPAGGWHTLVADGYIHSRLGWHLEHAGDSQGLFTLLREETADGHNAWFEVNERLGEPAVFLEDVARARRLSPTPGLLCRYVLMLSSLNSRADNVPTELILALVRQGLWSVEQALDYARRKPTSGERAVALAHLISQAGEGDKATILSQALQSAASTSDEPSRSRALVAVAPHLPRELIYRALTIAASIDREPDRSSALAAFAPHLPRDERVAVLTQAIEAISNIGHDSRSSSALVALAPHLPTELLQQALRIATGGGEDFLSITLAGLAPHLSADLLHEALQAAVAIRNEHVRSSALAELAPYLPADERIAVLEQALQAARAIRDELSRCLALASLAPHLAGDERAANFALALQAAPRQFPSRCGRAVAALARHLPADLLPQALRTAADISEEGASSRALAALAPHLPVELLPEALGAVAALRNNGHRNRAVAALAPHLPADLLPEALHVTADVSDEGSRSSALAALAPHLPPATLATVLAQALRSISIGNEYSRSVALAALAPHLPVDLFPEAIHAAFAIRDEGSRSGALSALAPHMPADLLPDVLRAAATIRNEHLRSSAVAALAPNIPANFLPQALRLAASIQEEYPRSQALEALAPHVPPCLLPEVLRAITHIGDERLRGFVWAALAAHLPTDLLPVALDATTGIGDEHSRGRVLVALAPHLPAALTPRGLRIAASIGDDYLRSRALASFAPSLPANERTAVLTQALQAAASLDDHYRGHALAVLVPHLPTDEQAAILDRALQGIADERSRSDTLSALAPYLSAALVPQALRIAASIHDGPYRSSALAALAPHLPADLLPQAMRTAAAIGDECSRGEALVALAPHLPPKLLQQTLPAASGGDKLRSNTLVALAPHLPAVLLPQALQAAAAVGDEHLRSRAVARIVARLAHVGGPELPERFADLLDLLGAGSRQTFADVVGDLVPIVTALPGFEAPAELAEVASAFIDVGRWWP